MAKKTRDRIIETAISLFNERGYGNVTTAILAKELGISEGNLWYHFNEKRALLSAITLLFITRNDERRLIKPAGGDILQEFSEFLKFLANEIRDFRFLWRDKADYGIQTDELLEKIPGSYRDTIDQYRAFFREMRDQKFLKIDDKALEPMIINIVVVTRYYLEFARESGISTDNELGPIRQSLLQLVWMLESHMTEEATSYLRQHIIE